MILFFKKYDKSVNLNYLKKLKPLSEGAYYNIIKPIQGEDLLEDEEGRFILGDSIYPLTSSQVSYKNVFSGIVYDNKTQSIEGYRDTLGTRPFYYVHDKDFFVYSNSIKAIRDLIQNTLANEDWIIKTLSGIAPHRDETFFQEIKALPPGFKLSLVNGGIDICSYHNLTPTLSSSSLKSLFNKALNERSFGKLGVELSGGLDSSGIAGALAALNPKQEIVALRHVLPPEVKGKVYPYKDEHYYSNLIVKKHSNINVIDVYSRRGILEELRGEMQHIGTPFYSALSLFFDELYDLAKAEGVSTLFSGFGGDEGVSNKAGAYIKVLSQQKSWFRLAQATTPYVVFKQMIKSIVNHQAADWREEVLPNRMLRTELLERYRMDKLLLSETGNVQSLERSIISRLNGEFFLSRLTENSQSVQTRGIRYSYPLLDTNLLSAYLSIPSSEKFNYRLPRSVYRSIVKDYIPKEIYFRNDKTSATVPTVYARFLRDYDLLNDFLHTYRKGKASEWVDMDKMIAHLPKIKSNALGTAPWLRLDLRLFVVGLQMILYFDEKVL